MTDEVDNDNDVDDIFYVGCQKSDLFFGIANQSDQPSNKTTSRGFPCNAVRHSQIQESIVFFLLLKNHEKKKVSEYFSNIICRYWLLGVFVIWKSISYYYWLLVFIFLFFFFFSFFPNHCLLWFVEKAGFSDMKIKNNEICHFDG